jgi:hypothetical protein
MGGTIPGMLLPALFQHYIVQSIEISLQKVSNMEQCVGCSSAIFAESVESPKPQPDMPKAVGRTASAKTPPGIGVIFYL